MFLKEILIYFKCMKHYNLITNNVSLNKNSVVLISQN